MKSMKTLIDFLPVIAMFLILLWALCLPNCSLYDYINGIKPNPINNDVPLIVCSSCKGKGEKPTDVNKLMMDAKMQLFVNKHFMVDKCEKCIKLPDAYEYCDVVNEKHQTLLKEYDAVGPKIDMAACEQCMGMGTFSSKDLTTGKWLTQEEYDAKKIK